jgi:3-deoxy-D-manno-octulosonic-acid transferase
LLHQFDLILAQDSDSQIRLASLGANDVGLVNLKTLAQALAYDPDALDTLRRQIGDRAVVLGASTHLGEDEIILRAWASLAEPKPLLILAPRHPERGASLEGVVQKLGLGKVARRSQGQTLSASVAVYIADTLGEMGLFYRLARVTLMGGSLLPGIGGHNPLEPARLGSVIISGNQVFNFSKVYADMLSTGGLELVSCEAELMKALNLIWHDQSLAKTMAQAALDYSAREAGDMDRLWTSLSPILPTLSDKGVRA